VFVGDAHIRTIIFTLSFVAIAGLFWKVIR
jgi:hypothetical protein